MKQIRISNTITKRESESFKKYLREISEIKPFESANDEYICAMKAFKGDKNAKTELIRRNLRFVISCAKQYQMDGILLSDLVNQGNIGITAAADRYDPTLGFKFISYAVWYIRKEILAFLSANSRTIRLPINRVNAIAKFKLNMSKLEQTLERPVNEVDMLEAYDEYTQEEIELFTELSSNNNITSLDMSVGDDDGSTFVDLMSDSSMGNADDLVMKSDMDVNINRIISILTPHEKIIITMLYGLDGQSPCTLSDVGERFDISRESIRKQRDKAFRKINVKFKRNIANLLSH